MKRIANYVAMGGLVTGLAGFSSVWAQTATPEPSQPKASAPAAADQPASKPSVSPAVRAAENAEQPGKMRPENAVVPQLSVPLRSAKEPSGAALPLPPPNGQRDDRAAACAAHITKEERQKCERSL